MRTHWGIALGTLLVFMLFVLGAINLESYPPLWWDEGWTLCVARTWVELGHYGCLLAGEPAPPGLTAAFPVVAPVALSFRWMGVGIWQGRFVGLFFTVGALALLYYLAKQLYNRPVAIGALVILLLMPLAPATGQPHFAFAGKQVLGEAPTLFYLLAGYVCFLLTLRKTPLFLPLAVGLWGVALKTKGQVPPFWIASLVIPLAVTLIKHHWRSAGLLAVGLIGSLGASQLLLWGQHLLLRGRTLPPTSVSGLNEVSAIAPYTFVRLAAFQAVLYFALPTLLGLWYATHKWLHSYRQSDSEDGLAMLRLMLLTLAGSWLVWYVLLSAGYVRYLVPPTFVGSIFAAALLYELTDRFSLASTVQRSGQALRHLRINWQNAGALLAIALVTMVLTLNLRTLAQFYLDSADTSVLQVAHFFNTQTETDTLIETYDSELFFLLDRPYHYPPDQIHVELMRRVVLGQDVPIEYDPLAADPDYLVVGPFVRIWGLYQPAQASDAFRLLRTYGDYRIYERVR
jgi:hypothetical protein